MGKKRGLVAVGFLLLLCLGVFFWYRHSLLNRVIDYQPMQIMVDGRKYIHNGTAAQERPQEPPDGAITKVNGKTDYPDADGEANFGTVGMPYWRDGANIIVESSQYYVFYAAENQE